MFLGEHTVELKGASNAYFERWSEIHSFVCKDPFNKYNHINKERVYLCFIISIRQEEGRGFFQRCTAYKTLSKIVITCITYVIQDFT